MSDDNIRGHFLRSTLAPPSRHPRGYRFWCGRPCSNVCYYFRRVATAPLQRRSQLVVWPQPKSRYASATTLLRTLYWLPVKARIQYKIDCLCFQCIYQNSMPHYISDLLHPYCPSRTLRSLDTSLLTVPRFSLGTLSKRSFSVFGPTVWNSLPLSLRKIYIYIIYWKCEGQDSG